MVKYVAPSDPMARPVEISQANYDRMWQNDGAGAQRIHEEGQERIWLWDMVDGSKSGPFPMELVYRHYLRKVVQKCSACNFTTIFDSGMASHVERVREKADVHQGDVIIDAILHQQSVKTCTACGVSFHNMLDAMSHVRAAKEGGPVHQDVQWALIKRFSLEAPSVVPVVRPVIQAQAETNGSGLATQERSTRKRHRSRGRGRARSA
jgi:hypothetical protein